MKGKTIIGNWKMNPETAEEALFLAKGIIDQLGEVQLPKVEVGIAPPFVFLEEISKVAGDRILLGAQDVFWESKGAYTGEVSAEELKSVGVQFVIIGHSERRKMGETDEEVNRKVRKALKEGLRVILCVGEEKEMRNKGIDVAKRFVSGELEKGLEKTGTVLGKKTDNLVIAYEPLWAISDKEGSEPATPEKAAEMISFIKKFLEIDGIAGGVKVLYGGSVDSENAGDFLKKEGIDGVLVGAASLDSEEFIRIINSDVEGS